VLCSSFSWTLWSILCWPGRHDVTASHWTSVRWRRVVRHDLRERPSNHSDQCELGRSRCDHLDWGTDGAESGSLVDQPVGHSPLTRSCEWGMRPSEGRWTQTSRKSLWWQLKITQRWHQPPPPPPPPPLFRPLLYEHDNSKLCNIYHRANYY